MSRFVAKFYCLVTGVILVVLALSTTGSAQGQFGILPFSTVSGGPDEINLGTLGFIYSVPVFSRAGRGKPLSISQNLQNDAWSTGYNSLSQLQWMPSFSPWGVSGTGGLANGVGYVFWTRIPESCPYNPQNPSEVINFYYYSFGFVDNGSTIHGFGLTLSTLTSELWLCAQYSHETSGTGLATDGSGMSVTASLTGNPITPTAVVTLRDGTVLDDLYSYESGVGTSTDSNGNQKTWNQTWNNGALTSFTVTDTLGTSPISGNGSVYSYTAPSGATAKFVVNTAIYTVQTDFKCPGIAEFPATQYTLVSGYTLPDGSTYKVTYEPTTSGSSNVTGRIASVVLPTGGTISYAYQGGDEDWNCLCRWEHIGSQPHDPRRYVAISPQQP